MGQYRKTLSVMYTVLLHRKHQVLIYVINSVLSPIELSFWEESTAQSCESSQPWKDSKLAKRNLGKFLAGIFLGH